jgi:hypothetical protein
MAQAQTGITGNKTPAPATTQTGIAGNNSGQIGQATTARAKAHDKSVYFHAAVALVLLVLGVTLAGQNLSFFWKLVVGIAFIIVGGNIATVKGYDKYRATWPQIIRGLGWVVVVATLLMSGIGKWTGSVAEDVNSAAFCAAEPNNPKCVAAMREKANAKAKAEAEAARRSYTEPVEARPVLLDETSYEMKMIGKFEPITLSVDGQSRVGPLNQYDGSCFYVIKTGAGKLQVYSRPDFTSNPVPAVMDGNGVGVAKWGHDGPAFQVFYEAVEGKVTLEVERREGNNSCR